MKPEVVDELRRAQEAAKAANDKVKELEHGDPGTPEASEGISPTKRFDLLWIQLNDLIKMSPYEKHLSVAAMLPCREVIVNGSQRYGLIFNLDSDDLGPSIHAEWRYWGEVGQEDTDFQSKLVNPEKVDRYQLDPATQNPDGADENYIHRLSNMEWSVAAYLKAPAPATLY